MRDYIHVTDLAAAHVAALDRLVAEPQASHTLNAGYGRGFSVNQVLDAVDRVTNMKLDRRYQGRRAGDPAALISEYLAGAPTPPGFGQIIYRERDPRAEFLLDAISRLPGIDAELVRTASRLIEEFDERRGWFPNSDFALALFAEATEMVSDGGDVIFTISRLAGWTAHALEEYAEPPLRFRLHGLYVGERPPDR